MKHVVVIYFTGMLACVAWRFWLGAQSNKGGLGQRNLKEIGAASTIVHALRTRISRFPGFAARARRSTKPPCYAGYRYINTDI